jgi:hypothetical protein
LYTSTFRFSSQTAREVFTRHIGFGGWAERIAHVAERLPATGRAFSRAIKQLEIARKKTDRCLKSIANGNDNTKRTACT